MDLILLSTELTSESVGSDIIVSLSLLLKGDGVEESLGLVHLGGQQLIIVVLCHLLLLLRDISVLLDLSVDIFKLLHSLVDGGVKLHGVLSSMLQSLLEVGDLS